VVGELPTAWQETKVVFIPKAGKATHTTAKDFRPISLTSFLLKSFEIIISLNIRATVDPTQISEAQQAYTKGKSTKSALHLVVKVHREITQHQGIHNDRLPGYRGSLQ